MITELDGLNTLYKEIQANSSTQISLLDNAHRFIDLRLQLILLTLPHYLGLPGDFRPQPNETVGQFLDRVMADAKKTENWPLLLKEEEASRIVARGISGGFISANSSSGALKSFIIGQNQEQAGQYSSAVLSYQEALRDTEGMVPLILVRDRLASIKKDHSKEYDEAMQRQSNPPSILPSTYHYPFGARPNPSMPMRAPILGTPPPAQ
jgi:hypothetical protein